MNTLKFVIFGFLFSLLFPPYFITPLAFVIFPYICYFFENKAKQYSKLKIFLYIFSFGFAFFLSFLFWIKEPFFVFDETKNYFYFSFLLILILSLIFTILFFTIYNLFGFINIVFLIPLIFVIFEYIISNLIYGFPWITFSLIISNLDFLSLIFKHFGTLVTSYLVLQIFCLPYLFIRNRYFSFEMRYIILVLLLPLISIYLIHILFFNHHTFIKTIKFELFQLNYEANFKKKNSEERMIEIVDKINESNSDVLIFAENNFPFIINDTSIKKIKDILKKNQTVIIGGTKKENNKYYNTLINIESENTQSFDKKILVPFGEFLPFRNYFKFMENISGMNDYSIGTKKRLIHLNKQLSYIPVICYEIIFYSKLVNKINYNSDFIVNITNDIWFGTLRGPYQHFYLTKIRAAELNKIILRVSNNGISAIINQNGKILKKTELNKYDHLIVNIDINKNNSFYSTHFILKIYLFLNFILLTLIYYRKNNEF